MKKIALFSTLALAAVATLASCQKETEVEIPMSTIYLTTGGVSANEVNYVVNYDALTGSETTVGAASFSVKLASTEPAGADITVTLKADETLVASPWTLLPEAAYTLSATTLTLAKDASESEAVTVTLHPEAVAETGQYLLPLSVEVNEGKAELSATAAVVNVKFVRNRLNSDIVPEGWSKISSDRFTAGSYNYYAGWAYEGCELEKAFDGDAATEWFSYAAYYENGEYYYAEDYSSWYGCFAEIKFSEPVALKGLIASMNPDSQNYYYRARRLSVMFKCEGDSDYVWTKTYGDGYEYDDNWNIIGTTEDMDDAYYYFCPKLEYSGSYSNNIDAIPEYKGSPADFCINDSDYTNYPIDLSAALEGKKVEALILMPSSLSVFKSDWDDELQDFWYGYYYDYCWGTVVGEITFFE